MCKNIKQWDRPTVETAGWPSAILSRRSRQLHYGVQVCVVGTHIRAASRPGTFPSVATGTGTAVVQGTFQQHSFRVSSHLQGHRGHDSYQRLTITETPNESLSTQTFFFTTGWMKGHFTEMTRFVGTNNKVIRIICTVSLFDATRKNIFWLITKLI